MALVLPLPATCRIVRSCDTRMLPGQVMSNVTRATAIAPYFGSQRRMRPAWMRVERSYPPSRTGSSVGGLAGGFISSSNFHSDIVQLRQRVFNSSMLRTISPRALVSARVTERVPPKVGM